MSEFSCERFEFNTPCRSCDEICTGSCPEESECPKFAQAVFDFIKQLPKVVEEVEAATLDRGSVPGWAELVQREAVLFRTSSGEVVASVKALLNEYDDFLGWICSGWICSMQSCKAATREGPLEECRAFLRGRGYLIARKGDVG